jgi:hypothetical protein
MRRPLIIIVPLAFLAVLCAKPTSEDARPSMTSVVLHAWLPELGSPGGMLTAVDRELFAVASEVRRGRFRRAQERLQSAASRAEGPRDQFMILLFRREVARFRMRLLDGGLQSGGDTLMEGLAIWNADAGLLSASKVFRDDSAHDAEVAARLATLIHLELTEIPTMYRWQSMALSSPEPQLRQYAKERREVSRQLDQFVTAGKIAEFNNLADGIAAAAENDPVRAQSHFQKVLEQHPATEQFATAIRIGDAYAFPAGDPLARGVDVVNCWALIGAIEAGQRPRFAAPLTAERSRNARSWYARAAATASTSDQRRAVHLRMAALEPTTAGAIQRYEAIARESGDDVVGWAALAAVGTLGGRASAISDAITSALREGATGTAASFAAQTMIFASTWRRFELDIALATLESVARAAEDHKLDRTTAEVLLFLARKYGQAGRSSAAVVAARLGVDRQTRFIGAYSAALMRLTPPLSPEAIDHNLREERYLLGRLVLEWRHAVVGGTEESLVVAEQAWSEFVKDSLGKLDPRHRQSLERSLQVFDAEGPRTHLARVLARGDGACGELKAPAAELRAAYLRGGARARVLELNVELGECGADELRREHAAMTGEDLLAPVRAMVEKRSEPTRLREELDLAVAKLLVLRAMNDWSALEQWSREARNVAKSDSRLQALDQYGTVLLADALRGQGRTDEALDLIGAVLTAGRADHMAEVLNVLMSVYVRAIGQQCGSAGARCDPIKALSAYQVALFTVSMAGRIGSGVTVEDRASAERASLEADLVGQRKLEPQALARVGALQKASGSDRLFSETAPLPEQSVEQLVRMLPARVTVLAYGLAEDDLVIWILRRGDAQLIYKPGVGKRVTRSARTLQNDLLDGVDGRWKELADRLSRDLIHAAGPLAAGEVVVIAADGVLARTPFEILTGRNGQPLGDSHPIVYVQSLLSYAAVAAVPIGSPVVIGVNGDGLVAAESEALEVARTLGTTARVDVIDAADAARAIRVAPIVHIAAHVRLSPTNPYDSSVSLGGGKRLTAWQLFRDVPAAELITLSACNTAMEASFTGGVSTPRGSSNSLVSFAFAGGAHFVLSSLWTASDQITADLMSHFYTAIGAGTDAVHALHEAKLAVRRSMGPIHPHYLANFRLEARNTEIVIARLSQRR